MIFSILVTCLPDSVSPLLGEFRSWLTLSGTEAACSLTDTLNGIQQRFVVCLTHFCSIILYDLVTESFVSVFTRCCIEEKQSGVRKQWLEELSSHRVSCRLGSSRNAPSPRGTECCVTTTNDGWEATALCVFQLALEEKKQWNECVFVLRYINEVYVFDSNEAAK